jgi:hypothetical protein
VINRPASEFKTIAKAWLDAQDESAKLVLIALQEAEGAGQPLEVQSYNLAVQDIKGVLLAAIDMIEKPESVVSKIKLIGGPFDGRTITPPKKDSKGFFVRFPDGSGRAAMYMPEDDGLSALYFPGDCEFSDDGLAVYFA